MAKTPKDTPNGLTPSWQLVPQSISLFRRHFVPLLYVAILPSLITELGLTLIGNFKDPKPTAHLGIAIFGIGLAVSILSIGAQLYLEVSAANGMDTSIPQIYQRGVKYLPRMIGFTALFSVLFLVGVVLFIVPGLIVMRRYYLAPYYLVDRNLSIKEAMRQSAKDSKPAASYIWGILGVAVFFALIAQMMQSALGDFGLILSILCGYLYIFAPALRYKELASSARNQAGPAPYTPAR